MSGGGEYIPPVNLDEAPVFRPNVKEFADPSRYIESISEQVRPYGICKIIPPATWKPPYKLDKNTFGFKTRVQQINYLDGQARLRLTFVENLCRFLAKRGTPLERLPIVEFRVLDLCRLYREVVTVRGGMNAVSEQKQWSEVARVLGMSAAAGGSLRQHYARILLPYEMHRKEIIAKQEAASQPPLSGAEGAVSSAGEERIGLSQDKAEGDGKDSTAVAADRSSRGNSQHAQQTQGQLGEGGNLAAETATAGAQKGASSQPAESTGGDVPAQAKSDHGDSDDEYTGFGYHDGKRYTLASYKEMADGFKSDYFRKEPTDVSEDQVEKEYWRIVTTAEHDMKIEYGSELHTTIHGSGFPTSGNALNPLDGATGSVYTRSPWNLNNLNACSLLRFVKEDIPGVISPWVYVGMCFSTFCWHCEDHFLYSINYLWEGEPKIWYGVSGDDAEAFEQVMREYSPELFQQQPDLLFHLVTMISPTLVRNKGLNVCKAVQRAGEFMLTFPRAYHGGFNTGYNVAESCNFAVTNWIPWGWLGDQEYKKFSRAQVFSHLGFLCSLAESDDSVQTAVWLLPDLQRYVQVENAMVELVRSKGLYQMRSMELSKAGVLSKPLVISDKNVVKGKRVRKSLYKTQVITGMDEVRRPRDEDEFLDECFICRGSTYLSQVRCPNCTDRVGCVEHAEDMCSCPLSCKFIERRFPDVYLDGLITAVAQRANRPAAWKERAEQLLAPPSNATDLQPTRLFQSMVTEADRFPRFLTWVVPLRDKLKEVVTEARAWAQRAQTLLAVASPVNAKGKAKDNDDAVLLADLEELAKDAAAQRVLQDDMPAVMALMERVDEWRASVKVAFSEGGLTTLQWADLLASGEVLRVQMPEIKKVASALEMRHWQDSAAEAMSATPCDLERLRELLSLAEASRFNAPEAKVIKEAVSRADVLRSKVAKARERGTTVSALRAMVEEVDELGLAIELDECKDAKIFIAKCDDWRERVSVELEMEKPLLRDLEVLQGEYKALGVYIDMHDELKPRVAEGQAWLNKAKKVASTMLAWHAERRTAATAPEQQQQQQHAEAHGSGMQRGEGQMAGAAARAFIKNEFDANGSPMHGSTGGSTASGGRGSGSKRGSDAVSAEAPSKRQKKTDEFECGTDRIHFFSKTLPAFAVVRDLVAEGEKLRCSIDELAVLQSKVMQHEEWIQRVQAAIQDESTPLLELFNVYHDGILTGIDISEYVTPLLTRIWSVRVTNALSAEAVDPEALTTMQDEAVTLQIGADNELARRLEEAAKKANPITCFCGQLLKGTPTVACVQCGLAFHGVCLTMSSKELTQNQGCYVCGPCKRKTKVNNKAVLPAGWEDYIDPSGRVIYIHRDSKRTSWDPPPGMIPANSTRGRLDYVPNVCIDRVGQEHSEICMVCFEEDEAGDVRLKCRECGMNVHDTCYGIRDGSKDEFTCRSCEFAVRNASCPMCPLTGGAVKPLTVGGWAHMVCANFLPELHFADAGRMEPIDGAAAVSKDRKRIKCSVCKTTKGAVVQCDEAGCKVSWHPLCGMESGLYMSMLENESGSIVTIMKCPKHGPKDEDDEDNKLYCLCQQRYVEGELMIECEACNGWYHPKCVGIKDKDADKLSQWKCPVCKPPPAATSTIHPPPSLSHASPAAPQQLSASYATHSMMQDSNSSMSSSAYPMMAAGSSYPDMRQGGHDLAFPAANPMAASMPQSMTHQGMNQGMNLGMIQGMGHGGLNQGMSQGTSQGLNQGMNLGMGQGMPGGGYVLGYTGMMMPSNLQDMPGAGMSDSTMPTNMGSQGYY